MASTTVKRRDMAFDRGVWVWICKLLLVCLVVAFFWIVDTPFLMVSISKLVNLAHGVIKSVSLGTALAYTALAELRRR